MKHASHETRFSDSSFYDEICVHCGAHDETPGGWGDLALPCPGTPPDLRCDDFGLECCSLGPLFAIYSPSYLKYGSPNLWGRFCASHNTLIAHMTQMDWTNAMVARWKRWLEKGCTI